MVWEEKKSWRAGLGRVGPKVPLTQSLASSDPDTPTPKFECAHHSFITSVLLTVGMPPESSEPGPIAMGGLPVSRAAAGPGIQMSLAQLMLCS